MDWRTTPLAPITSRMDGWMYSHGWNYWHSWNLSRSSVSFLFMTPALTQIFWFLFFIFYCMLTMLRSTITSPLLPSSVFPPVPPPDATFPVSERCLFPPSFCCCLFPWLIEKPLNCLLPGSDRFSFFASSSLLLSSLPVSMFSVLSKLCLNLSASCLCCVSRVFFLK